MIVPCIELWILQWILNVPAAGIVSVAVPPPGTRTSNEPCVVGDGVSHAVLVLDRELGAGGDRRRRERRSSGWSGRPVRHCAPAVVAVGLALLSLLQAAVPNANRQAVAMARRFVVLLMLAPFQMVLVLKLGQMVRAERVRQQTFQGERRPDAFWSCGIDGCTALGELADSLPATTAAGSDRLAIAHRQDGDDLAARRRRPSPRSPPPRHTSPAGTRRSRRCSRRTPCRWRFGSPRQLGSASREHGHWPARPWPRPAVHPHRVTSATHSRRIGESMCGRSPAVVDDDAPAVGRKSVSPDVSRSSNGATPTSGLCVLVASLPSIRCTATPARREVIVEAGGDEQLDGEEPIIVERDHGQPCSACDRSTVPARRCHLTVE